MPFGSRNGFREVPEDQVGGHPWPGLKMSSVDGSDKGGDCRAESSGVEE